MSAVSWVCASRRHRFVMEDRALSSADARIHANWTADDAARSQNDYNALSRQACWRICQEARISNTSREGVEGFDDGERFTLAILRKNGPLALDRGKRLRKRARERYGRR